MSASVELRLPELSGGSEAEQLRQIRKYLYSLAEQLQFAFDGAAQQAQVQQLQNRERTPAETFTSIKSLIVKSADIAEAISQETERQLEGKYIASGEFGSFRQEMEQKITESAGEIRQSFRNLQEVSSTVAEIASSLMEVNACIRTGLLYEDDDGMPVYGVEIGQQETVDGLVVFRKFARLTAAKLSFYDSSGNEAAWISDLQLHVILAQIHSLTAKDIGVQRIRIGDCTVSAGSDGHVTVG